MAVPKTIETRCRDGSVRTGKTGYEKTTQTTPSLYTSIFFLPHGIDVPRISIAKLTEQFQVKEIDVGMGLLV